MSVVNPPYLISQAIQASKSPAGLKKFQNALRRVRELKLTELPQTSLHLLQPALVKMLDRSASFPDKSTGELLDEFSRRTNDFFNDRVVSSRSEAMKLILRLGCVLLRMQRLDRDPQIAKLIIDTDCLKTNLNSPKDVPDLSNSNLKALTSRLVNARTSASGALLDTTLLGYIETVFRKIPRTRLAQVKDLADGLLEHIKNIYDRTYLNFSPNRSDKMPVEFLFLLKNERPTFNGSAFAMMTKKLFDTKSLKDISADNFTSKLFAMTDTLSKSDEKVRSTLEKKVSHAQTLLVFYKKQDSMSRTNRNLMTVLRRLYRAFSVFQQKAPRNMDALSNMTFDFSALLSVKHSERNNDEERAVREMKQLLALTRLSEKNK